MNTNYVKQRIPVYLFRILIYIILTAVIFAIVFSVTFVILKINTNTGPLREYPKIVLQEISPQPPPQINIEAHEYNIPEKVYEYEYKTDISQYEIYIDPPETERNDYLLLINYENLLSEDYKPNDLIQIPTRAGRDVQYMRNTPANALKAFLNEAKACDIKDVTVTSGWRSYNTQVWLLSQQVAKYEASPYFMSNEDAYNLAITEVAIPGTSEHQSGLCVDMHNLPSADISFANTASAQWLADNCYKFGFIIRFPKDKTEITKISFEPWHFRFVGRYHATRIHEMQICLEEYIDYLEQNSLMKN